MQHGNSYVFQRRKQSQKLHPQIPQLINRTQVRNPQPLAHHFVVDSSQTHLGVGSPSGRAHLPHLTGGDGETTNGKTTTSRNVYTRSYPDGPSNTFDGDRELDSFMSKVSTLPLNEAIEVYMAYHFDAKEVLVWEEISDLQMLHSKTKNTILPHTTGLPGFCFFTRAIIRMSNPTTHQAYNQQFTSAGANTPVLLCPLWNHKNTLCSVIEVIRPPNAPEFTAMDEEFMDWFMKKFKMLSKWIIPVPPVEQFTLDVMQLMRTEQYLSQTITKISQFFNCRACDIWKLNKTKNEITKITDTISVVQASQAGIAGDALSRESPVYCVNNKMHSSYNPECDGNVEEAVLALPVKEPEDSNVYVVVLRGPKNGSLFSTDDQSNLKKLAPIILLSLSNVQAFTAVDDEFQSSRLEREGLAALLEVIELLSSQLNADKLTELIMEKGRMLTNSDRCSLFLVNDTRDRLITSLHQGLSSQIDIPINKGIAGKTVTEGKILNIADAYETDFFDSSTDTETGYKTKSILSVPIYNNRGEIIGVTEMVNKLDSRPFTQWDTNLIQIFNVYCGISLENARLYNDSLEMQQQLRSFFDLSFSLAKSESTQRLMNDILQNARKTMDADRASIFLIDEGKNCLSTFLADGGKVPPTIPLNIGIAAHCIKTKSIIVENDAYHNPQFNRQIDIVTSYRTRSLIASPILTPDGQVLGVVEMVNKNKGDFCKKDQPILSAFTTFASIALQNSRLKDIAELGDVEIEMNKWIGESERNGTDIPTNLQLTPEQVTQCSSLNFFSIDYKGIGHFKELFYIFNKYNLLSQFKISNERFFRFVFTISSTYNQVPYHNWMHACDVTEYVNYEMTTCKFDKVFTSFEIFSILVAAICHDANHEGFNNVFNEKAETPYGILFKSQSVMEMHHITVAIPIITKDEINLFQAFSPDETKRMWSIFIKLILATDMAHHFELVKKAQGLLDEEKWTFDEPENRILAMQLILKVADISNVSRPFNLADKWCDILCNEFFRQGDLEKSTGIGLTSPLNDRENSDKPKSQIGFYNFICLPLYNVTARVFPELKVNADSVQSNLEVWKSLAAQNAPPAT